MKKTTRQDKTTYLPVYLSFWKGKDGVNKRSHGMKGNYCQKSKISPSIVDGRVYTVKFGGGNKRIIFLKFVYKNR